MASQLILLLGIYFKTGSAEEFLCPPSDISVGVIYSVIFFLIIQIKIALQAISECVIYTLHFMITQNLVLGQDFYFFTPRDLI